MFSQACAKNSVHRGRGCLPLGPGGRGCLPLGPGGVSACGSWEVSAQRGVCLGGGGGGCLPLGLGVVQVVREQKTAHARLSN